MANILKIRKVTTLPGVYDPSTLYLVRNGSNVNLFDIYLSTDDGASVRHIITESDIQTKINTALAGFNNVQVVADIAARNALTPTSNIQVVVLDATGDGTVASGAATYVYQLSNTTWYKISEAESLDVVFSWANITGKPTSAVADIDDAVSKRHTHTNLSVLNGLGDSAGALTYSGSPIRAYLDEETW
jgi:hypothetical protein